MDKSAVIVRVVVVLLFLISLFFVEAGFCGSSMVAKYNNGIGTLDMKKYNVQSVKMALSPMNDKGFTIYKFYYVMDYIFIICFGMFQIMITHDIYAFSRNSVLQKVVIAIPILRSIFDIIENAILLRTLFTFPRINETAISVSSCFTQAKLLCIKAWMLVVAAGFIWRFVLHVRG